MADLKGINSYVSLAEADAYFEDRLDVAAWTEATETLKSQALVTATRVLEDKEWTGIAIDASQALSFPRRGSYFDPKAGRNLALSADVLPDRIARATFELAYHLLNNDGLLDDSGSVQNLSLGTINLTGIKKASGIPDHVYRMIRPLLQNAGSSVWWRAN